jgi:hypothetical protein
MMVMSYFAPDVSPDVNTCKVIGFPPLSGNGIVPTPVYPRSFVLGLEEARATLEAVQALAQKQFVSPYGIASYYAVIGDNERGLDWLEKAYSERDGTLVWLKVHPRLDGLRGEPRFRDLLARMRLDS